MKRILYIMMLLLATTACTKEDTPATQADVLYKHYAPREELTVARVQGFRLNDTVRLDVVLLVADDSAGWQRLKEEMDIRATEGITSWLGAIEEPARRVKRTEVPLWRAMAVHEERTLAFYRVATQAEFDALREYQMEEMRNEK